MTTTISAAGGELRVALDDIRLRSNVRELVPDDVDALAQSIALRGLLVPVIVRPVEDGYELVAGYHRVAACRQLGHTQIAVVVREQEGSSADSAAENIARKQLSALEEAQAVQAMLDEGYTADGAAQALGWSRQRVTARTKILKLPPVGQQLVGSGEIPLSAIDTLLTIGDVSPAITHAVVTAIASKKLAGSQLLNNLGWAIGQALRGAPKDTFAAYLNQMQQRDLAGLRLGKKTDALLTQAEKLHKQVDRYAYGPPQVRFSTADVDQARAAGVLIELDGCAPIVTDREVYRVLCRQAIARTVDELAERVSAAAAGKRAGGAGKRERTPREDLDVEHRASLRELTRQAHGVNLDLGAALLTELATVAADDLDIARFFAFGLLGADTKNYLATGDHVALTIAANGLRLVLDEHRTTSTPILKSGKTAKTKVTYNDPAGALKWMWRFVDAAKTAGELYGRAMVVFAAQHYASQLVLPASKRRGSVLPRSHNDNARKAFERATKSVLPGSYTQLQRALTAEARAYKSKVDQLDKRTRQDRAAAAAANTVEVDLDQHDVDLDEDLDEDVDVDG